jgi:CRISPR-associated exonuclease Cas4
MPASETTFSIPASLIRQHVFCPRIPFYNEILGINPGDRLWQHQGIDFHQRQAMLLKRRNLRPFGLENPKLQYNVSLRSITHGIHGICDAILFAQEEICPLEFKLDASKAPQRGHILQLGAYALMAEEQFGKHCKRLFILYGTRGQTCVIPFDQKIRTAVMQVAMDIRQNLNTPLLPASPATSKQCGQCEYLNFCADRDD